MFLINERWGGQRLICAAPTKVFRKEVTDWLKLHAKAQGGAKAFSVLCIPSEESCYAHQEDNWLDHASAIITPRRPVTVFKKVRGEDYNVDSHQSIAHLVLFPGEPIRLGLYTRHHKCRTSIAFCEKITPLHYPRTRIAQAHSIHDEKFKYRPGEVVKPTSRYTYNGTECASGIHFFFGRQEARAWNL